MGAPPAMSGGIVPLEYHLHGQGIILIIGILMGIILIIIIILAILMTMSSTPLKL